MTAERWRIVKELFDEVQSVRPPERHAWLMAASENDSEVRRAVLALVEADDASNGFLEISPLTCLRTALEVHLGAVPERIGPWRIQREIGRGGMGVVYLASRDDGTYEKAVAIKLVRAGFDAELLRRFHSERQILADLDHPCVARLLDGGTTEQGYAYLVMEYIDGEPITSYCDHHRLPVSDRLRLFQAVCAAVQHAHEKGIIHRDLKPANILVRSDGEPRLLDFGVASLLGPTRHTQATGRHPMTLDYASPEQIRGAALTPSSDCYSLAVILYELVTGTRPFESTGASAFEAEQAALNITPEPPGTQAYRNGAAVAWLRGTTPDWLRRALRGDIENIVLMGLRKEPERRYATASALADDIRRHLESFPVLARRDTLGYRTSRFVLRNRRLASVAMAAALAIGAVSGIAVSRDRRAAAERRILEARSQEASRFGMSLLDAVYRQEKKNSAPHTRQPEPGRDQDPQANIAWAYGYKGEPRVGGKQTGGPDLKSILLEFEKARRVLEPAVAADPSDAPSTRSLALTYERLAWAQSSVDVASSVESYRRQLKASERLARLRQRPPAQVYLATALRSLGERLGHPYYANTGDTAAARREIERAVRMAEEWVPKLAAGREGTWYLGYCYSSLAGMLWSQGDIDGAIALQRRAITASDFHPPDAHRRMEVQAELGMLHIYMARFLHQKALRGDAASSLRKGLAILEPMFHHDPQHPLVRRYLIAARNQWGDMSIDSAPDSALRSYGDGEQLSVEGLARDAHSSDIRDRLAESRGGMARALAMLGNPARANQKSREAVELAEELSRLDPRNARYQFSLVLAYRNRGEVMERVSVSSALQEYRKGLALIKSMATADAASWLKREARADFERRLKRLTAQSKPIQ